MSLIKTYKRTIKQQEANRFENIAVVIRFVVSHTKLVK